MAKAPSLSLTGDKETIKMFHELGEPKQKRILKTSSEKGAKLIQAEARMRAPVRSGTLLKNIDTVVLIATDFFASVGVSFRINNQNDGYYGLFIEKGTRPRYMKNRKSKRYSVPKFVGEMVSEPFLVPAFDSKKFQAATIIKNDLKKSIFKEAKRYGAKS
jgi:HK97 gp10 family phage protein